MEKRGEFLEKKIQAELAKAKDCSKRKDKRGALMALKTKKLYEKVRARPWLHAGAACPLRCYAPGRANADERVTLALHRAGASAALQYGLSDGATDVDAGERQYAGCDRAGDGGREQGDEDGRSEGR